MSKKLTTEEFIEKAIKIHGDKYDYSLVDYKKTIIKVKIICKEHGIFEQRPNDHLGGKGCKKCGRNLAIKQTTMSLDEFIEKANKKHKFKYNYNSIINYINTKHKIPIKCLIHGIFYQTGESHLCGQGCPKCAIENSSKIYSLTINEFINRSNDIHNNKYDYSMIKEYKNAHSKVSIICPIHGVFYQSPDSHLRGSGCKKCGIESIKSQNRFTTEQFLNKAKMIHNNRYDYSLVNYKNNLTKVQIICKDHGVFKQTPISHLHGSGCPICSSSKGEQKILKYLILNNIKYIHQYSFGDCLSPKGNILIFDFFLPVFNLCIEYDGRQHYKKIEYFGGKEGLKSLQKHDKIKNEYCKVNKIKLLRIPFTKFDDIEFLIDEELNWSYDIINELF